MKNSYAWVASKAPLNLLIETFDLSKVERLKSVDLHQNTVLVLENGWIVLRWPVAKRQDTPEQLRRLSKQAEVLSGYLNLDIHESGLSFWENGTHIWGFDYIESLDEFVIAPVSPERLDDYYEEELDAPNLVATDLLEFDIAKGSGQIRIEQVYRFEQPVAVKKAGWIRRFFGWLWRKVFGGSK